MYIDLDLDLSIYSSAYPNPLSDIGQTRSAQQRIYMYVDLYIDIYIYSYVAEYAPSVGHRPNAFGAAAACLCAGRRRRRESSSGW